ncbi:protein-export chaperone SecB [Pseudooceanicola aestuarii]|uniref:protein-export chaperone SecB n=1 Tax=Pseudooceanicola aestuarii TaxID=2697319 RepID=UPI0013D6186D|nr:protein-export chaperone SecB [Pseudooceanicola aestuarii]
MSEEQNGAAAQQPQVRMNVQTQYVRDMSFENILAQKGSTGSVQPDVRVQVGLDAKKREAENTYEVILKLNVESVSKENPAEKLFILEIEYVGIFTIDGVPEEQMHPFLLIECPRMIFPFVRRIVSDVTRDGGFPPLNLDTIDFVSLYRQELARRVEAQKTAAPAN